MSAVIKLRRIPSGIYRLYDEASRIARNLSEVGSRLDPPAIETRESLLAYLREFARLEQARALAPGLVAEIDRSLGSGEFEEDAGAMTGEKTL